MTILRFTVPLVSILLFVSMAFRPSFEQQTEPKENIKVVFTNEMDFNDLVEIKLNMADRGISLMYQKLVFNDNGKLQGISFKVDCNDGFSGNAAAIPLSSDDPVGFTRNYDQDAKSPFGTG